MAYYVKQNFTDGMVLTAQHLNHMEEGIEAMLPLVGSTEAGMFLRVSQEGVWQPEALINVAEVGA